MVESGADQVVGRSWDVRLDPELTEDAGRYRKYDFSSVRDLLRVVRNKRHHFHELPERVQGLMSPLPSGFLRRGAAFRFRFSSFRGFSAVLCLRVRVLFFGGCVVSGVTCVFARSGYFSGGRNPVTHLVRRITAKLLPAFVVYENCPRNEDCRSN